MPETEWWAVVDRLLNHNSLLAQWKGCTRAICRAEEEGEYCLAPCAWCLWRIISGLDYCGECDVCREAQILADIDRQVEEWKDANPVTRMPVGWTGLGGEGPVTWEPPPWFRPAGEATRPMFRHHLIYGWGLRERCDDFEYLRNQLEYLGEFDPLSNLIDAGLLTLDIPALAARRGV